MHLTQRKSQEIEREEEVAMEEVFTTLSHQVAAPG